MTACKTPKLFMFLHWSTQYGCTITLLHFEHYVYDKMSTLVLRRASEKAQTWTKSVLKSNLHCSMGDPSKNIKTFATEEHHTGTEVVWSRRDLLITHNSHWGEWLGLQSLESLPLESLEKMSALSHTQFFFTLNQSCFFRIDWMPEISGFSFYPCSSRCNAQPHVGLVLKFNLKLF